MADLINEHVSHLTPGESNSEQLNRLVHNPMFQDLQATLMHDLTSGNVPYTLQNFSPFTGTPGHVVIQPEVANEAALYQDHAHNRPVTDTDALPDQSYMTTENNNDYKTVDLNLIQTYYSQYGKCSASKDTEQNVSDTDSPARNDQQSLAGETDIKENDKEAFVPNLHIPEGNQINPAQRLPTIAEPPTFGMCNSGRNSPENIIKQSFNTAVQITSPMKQDQKQFDMIVEDATLQAEFRQFAPLANEKVTELEQFYNRQSAEIIMQRTDAAESLKARGLDSVSFEHEMKQLNGYFDQQHEHLVQRISQSLQLLKEALPRDQCQGQTMVTVKKQNKSRLLNSKAVSVMNEWYQKHIDYPYPTDEEKQQLAESGNITLSQAATFGKCFLTDYQPEHFVHMCQMLRVLNAVREVKLAIPLTYTQLHHLSLTVLIDRLVLRREYHLAIEICKYLKLPDTEGASRILAHWACYKVQQTNIDDEAVARSIALKLGDTPGVSYSEIANKAIECGRTQLAVRLLDHEPRATEQVPLLMKMKKNREALKKAIESGDTDLVYTVVLQLKETMNLGEFLMNIRSYPVAHALFMQYCREQNRKLLQDMYEQEDQYNEEANCRVWECYQEERIEARLSCLVAAQDAYTKGRNDWAAKQTEEQTKLLRFQKKLEAEFNRPCVDLSLHQTMEMLIKQNQVKLVEQLRKDFRVPDRRFYWLKISCLASMSDWTELDKFSKSKKSPIGYEPFIEICMQHSNIVEAEKYLSRVAPENKAKCLIKMGKFDLAADAAFAVKDLDSLNLVQQKCGTSNRQIMDKVNNLKSQLGAKR